jgi:hypothetical protein
MIIYNYRHFYKNIGLIFLLTVLLLTPIFVFVEYWSSNASTSELEYWRMKTMYYHHLLLLISILTVLSSALFGKYYSKILIFGAWVGFASGLLFAISNIFN